MIKTNEDLFTKAKKFMPGGVNSPVRAFNAVGGIPRFIDRASGSKMYDVEGAEYIDYVCSWGPLILGHANKIVVKELKEALERGTSFGTTTEKEVELAELICDMYPSIDSVRLVNSGTEAVMSAVRLARAYTERDLIVKLRGCYHGHVDSFLSESGSGLATLGIPSSPGVTKKTVEDTILCDYNDLEALETIFEKSGNQIAALIMEPIPGNMGLVRPKPGYLTRAREITRTHGSLLIFDEVITGFRVSKGGAQKYYNINPDLTILGKIVGGGLPIGAYGGSKEIMSNVAPEGKVYQAGTLSGNPLAVTAGLATLRYLKKEKPYNKLEGMTTEIKKSLHEMARVNHYPITFSNLASMFCIFFNKKRPTSWQGAKNCDAKKYATFFNEMLRHGVYFPPSQFETCFISTEHTEKDIDKTLKAAEKAFAEVFK